MSSAISISSAFLACLLMIPRIPPKAIEYFTVFYRRNLAWKQVTKLYENTNMREIVRKKAIANLGRDFIDRSRR